MMKFLVYSLLFKMKNEKEWLYTFLYFNKYNKSFRRNNSESTKNNGIRGIIKLVDKKGK